MLTNRQKEIIIFLLDENKSLTNRQLAERFQLSDRTIRNDIRAINEECRKDGHAITADVEGYRIRKKDISYFIQFSKINHQDIYESGFNREILILFELLWMEGPVKLDELAALSFLSHSTLVKSLGSCRKNELAGTPVSLVNSRQGIYLSGSESQKRDLIGKVLQSGYEKHQIEVVKQVLISLEIITNEDFLWLYDHMINSFNAQKIILTDKGMFLFTLECLILFNRIRNQFLLEPDYFSDDPVLALRYDEFERRFDVRLEEKERKYISSRIAVRSNITSSNLRQKEIREVTDAFLNELSGAYNISRSAIDPYLDGLENHLSAMIDRIENHIETDATMVNEIRLQYPYAFECSTAVIPLLNKYMGVAVSEAEIGYIAVHIAVILNSLRRKQKALVLCGSGIGTGMLISQRINTYFANQIDVVGPYPVYELRELLQREPDIDLVISTVPLPADTGRVPVLQISPVFSQRDFMKTASFLSSRRYSSGPPDPESYEPDKDLFFIFNKGETDETILRAMAEKMREKGLIEAVESFLSSIRERERLYSTLYGRIWLPHPMKVMAVRTGIACAVVQSGGKYDLVFLLSVRREDTRCFQIFYDKILALMDSPERVDELKSVSDFDQFVRLYHQI